MIAYKITRFSRNELLDKIALAKDTIKALELGSNFDSQVKDYFIKDYTKDIAKYQAWLDSCKDTELYIFRNQVINKDMPKYMKF